jgi:hypothetical protein
LAVPPPIKASSFACQLDNRLHGSGLHFFDTIDDIVQDEDSICFSERVGLSTGQRSETMALEERDVGRTTANQRQLMRCQFDQLAGAVVSTSVAGRCELNFQRLDFHGCSSFCLSLPVFLGYATCVAVTESLPRMSRSIQSLPPVMSNEQSGSEISESRSIDLRLAQILEGLQRQLTSPDAESLVAVAAAHNELRRMPATHVSALRVSCMLAIAQFFYISGQTVLGLEPTANAVSAARSLGDLRLLRRALMFQGILQADTGNVPGAIECHAEALEIAQRIGDRAGEGSVWNNLAAAFLYAAQYADSILASRG